MDVEVSGRSQTQTTYVVHDMSFHYYLGAAVHVYIKYTTRTYECCGGSPPFNVCSMYVYVCIYVSIHISTL